MIFVLVACIGVTRCSVATNLVVAWRLREQEDGVCGVLRDAGPHEFSSRFSFGSPPFAIALLESVRFACRLLDEHRERGAKVLRTAVN